MASGNGCAFPLVLQGAMGLVGCDAKGVLQAQMGWGLGGWAYWGCKAQCQAGAHKGWGGGGGGRVGRVRCQERAGSTHRGRDGGGH